jgi:hypothetical protein
LRTIRAAAGPRTGFLRLFGGEREEDLGVHAGEEFFVRVGEVDFGVHGAGGGVEGGGHARDGAGDDTAIEGEDLDADGDAGGDGGGAGLGDVAEDADDVEALTGEKGGTRT